MRTIDDFPQTPQRHQLVQAIFVYDYELKEGTL
jgi:hypothetical protein